MQDELIVTQKVELEPLDFGNDAALIRCLIDKNTGENENWKPRVPRSVEDGRTAFISIDDVVTEFRQAATAVVSRMKPPPSRRSGSAGS